MDTFEVGKAPWETGAGAAPGSFPVGKAPWEMTSPAVRTKSFADSLWDGFANSSVAKNISSDINTAGKNVDAAISGTNAFQGKGSIERGFSAASEAASAIPKVVADVIPGGKQALNLAGKASGGVIDFLGKLFGDNQLAQDFVTKHPEAAKTLETAASVGSSAGNIATTILGAEGVAKAGNAAVKTVTDASNTAKGALAVDKALHPPEDVASFVEKNVAGAPDAATVKIQDVISPKLTAKETRLALDQGRIVPGQNPGLLRDGTPDTVLPADRTINAAETIRRQIPNAENLKAPELYTALDTKIVDIAEKLRPEMEAVPITEATIEKISNDWEVVKARQLNDPYTPISVNVEKLQNQFETQFLQKSKAGHFGDLWDTAIKYDSSVPENVKGANSLSSDALQAQKAIWLQNRGVLRDAINDAANGLGAKSQTAFSNMTDMYNAQAGIKSSYKVLKDGAPGAVSKVVQFARKHKVLTAIGAATAAHVTGLDKAVIGTVLP